MLKLYRLSDSKSEYWETWENSPGIHTVHWGILGTEGNTKTVKFSSLRRAKRKVHDEFEEMKAESFAPISLDDHAVLIIEFAIEGMGSEDDLEKRHRLEDFMNEKLGWTGLGSCDGGSTGSGTMEVCNYVVDYETAKKVVEESLKDTEFSDYSRIYDQSAP